MLKHLFGLVRRRLVSAFLYSIAGFAAAWKSEEAIKVEVVLLPFFALAAFYWGESDIERALLVASLFLILIVELLNTAIEKTIDRISLEKNPKSKIVKDMGSAAVLAAILNAVVVWVVLLG